MTRYTEIKAQANKVMLAGIGGGCLLFAIGTLSKLLPLSVFGLLADAWALLCGWQLLSSFFK